MKKGDIGGSKPIIWFALVILILSVLMLCDAFDEFNLSMLNKIKPESKIIFGIGGTLAGSLLCILGIAKKPQ